MRSTHRFFPLSACFAFLFTTPLLAEDTEPNNSWVDRLEIHGHLSVAFTEATSTGLSGTLPSDEILGLSEDGSFDFRNAALQVRFAAADNHNFVLQLSHQKLGDSVLEQVNDDIEIDWLFWDWQIGPRTDLRLGRLPTPAGLFNEVRDVGTVLPFFRPAFNFYREGSLFSETVDGVGITHRFFDDSAWSLEANLYAGEFEIFEQGSAVDDDFIEVNASDAVGVQFWPQHSLEWCALRSWRIALRRRGRKPVQPHRNHLGDLVTPASKRISIAGFCVRSIGSSSFPFRLRSGPVETSDVAATYWQLGWRPSDRWSAYLQGELTDIEQRSAIYVGGSFETDDRDDLRDRAQLCPSSGNRLQGRVPRARLRARNLDPGFYAGRPASELHFPRCQQ